MTTQNATLSTAMHVPELYYWLVPPNLQPSDSLLTSSELLLSRWQILIINRDGHRFSGLAISTCNRMAWRGYSRFIMSLIYIRAFDGNEHSILVVVPDVNVLRQAKAFIETDFTLTTYGQIDERVCNDHCVRLTFQPHSTTPGCEQTILIATTEAMEAVIDSVWRYDTLLLYQAEVYPDRWFDICRRVYAAVQSQPNYLIALSTWTNNLSIDVFELNDLVLPRASTTQPTEELDEDDADHSDGSMPELEDYQPLPMEGVPMDGVVQISSWQLNNVE